jgi:hemoglobin
MAQTIFERYGGFAVMRKFVSTFYDKVLDSPDLEPYFEDVDMRRQIEHQTQFVSQLTGGPAVYTDEQLRRVHQRLNISRAHYAELIGLFEETLEDFEFERADIDHLMARLRELESHIVAHLD